MQNSDVINKKLKMMPRVITFMYLQHATLKDTCINEQLARKVIAANENFLLLLNFHFHQHLPTR